MIDFILKVRIDGGMFRAASIAEDIINQAVEGGDILVASFKVSSGDKKKPPAIIDLLGG